MVSRIVSKVLPFVLVACSAAFAQYTPCTIAPGAAVCTEITTQGGKYDPYNGWSYPETAEDSATPNFPADYNASVGAPAGFYFDVGLPFDPLLMPGGPIANPYGYTKTSLGCPTGCVTSTTTTTVLPKPRQVGAVMGTLSYTFAGLVNMAAGPYPYYWSGSYSLEYVCTRIGRYGCDNSPGPGTLTMSAFHQ